MTSPVPKSRAIFIASPADDDLPTSLPQGRNLTFTDCLREFQEKLAQDIEAINSSTSAISPDVFIECSKKLQALLTFQQSGFSEELLHYLHDEEMLRLLFDDRSSEIQRRSAVTALTGTTRTDILLEICNRGIAGTPHNSQSSISRIFHETTNAEAINWLCEVGLRHDKSRTRMAAAEALEHTSSPVAVEALRTLAASDPDVSVRRQVALALFTISLPRAFEALCQVAVNETDPSIRAEVCVLLHDLDSDLTVPTLIKVLQTDGDPGVRLYASYGLAETENQQALDTLCEYGLNDSDVQVRLESLHSLSHVPNEGCLDAIHRVLKTDLNRDVRNLARVILRSRAPHTIP